MECGKGPGARLSFPSRQFAAHFSPAICRFATRRWYFLCVSKKKKIDAFFAAGETKQNSCECKTTTTNRHGAKKSTTCRVFLLTAFSHGSILRIQIRGNVEAPGGPSRGRSPVSAGPPDQPGL